MESIKKNKYLISLCKQCLLKWELERENIVNTSNRVSSEL